MIIKITTAHPAHIKYANNFVANFHDVAKNYYDDLHSTTKENFDVWYQNSFLSKKTFGEIFKKPKGELLTKSDYDFLKKLLPLMYQFYLEELNLPWSLQEKLNSDFTVEIMQQYYEQDEHDLTVYFFTQSNVWFVQ